MIHILLIVLTVALVVHGAIEALYFAHMLQLSGYSNKEFADWRASHFVQAIKPSLWLLFLVAIVAFFAGVFTEYSGTFFMVMLCIEIAAVILSIFCYVPKKAKKPLVFTKRIWRLLVTFAILLGVLVALIQLVGRWLGEGSIVFLGLWIPVVADMLIILANLINKPIEKGIANHYVKDAKRILAERPDLIVIGITGSYGKTSTKNFLHSILSAKYNTFMTPASYNTTMGVVRAIRENLKPSHEVFICEMGAKGVGEIKEICDIVHPKYGLITSIGEQHLETFLSVENIIKTKFELADAIPEDGFVCLNMDNEFIANREVSNTRAVGYTISGEGYHAEDIELSPTGNKFTFVEPDGTKTAFTTKLLGEHNIQNVIGCLALARELGVPVEKTIYPVRLLKPVQHRLELLPNGFIDDAFNSNPAGFRAALNVLKSFEGQRILVTPGMVELGERQDPLNEELGGYAADCCDWAILVGERQAPPLKKGLLSAGYDEKRIYVAKSLNDALQFINTLPVDGKRIVLLENDLPDNYN